MSGLIGNGAQYIARYSGLLAELVRREFAGRYRGSLGGVLWSFVQPLFLLAIYTFTFGYILQVRWGIASDPKIFAFHVFAGLIVFNAFSECLRQGPTLVVANPNFVKKVLFPLELLPVVTAVTALGHAFVGFSVWLVGYAVFIGPLHPTVLLFPLLCIVFLPVLLGLGWLLAAAGVFLRDMLQLTALLSQVLLFLTPIFYSIDVAPPSLRPILLANPLSFIVEQARRILIYGEAPDLPGMLVYFTIAVVFARLALALFQRLRPTFADLV